MKRRHPKALMKNVHLSNVQLLVQTCIRIAKSIVCQFSSLFYFMIFKFVSNFQKQSLFWFFFLPKQCLTHTVDHECCYVFPRVDKYMVLPAGNSSREVTENQQGWYSDVSTLIDVGPMEALLWKVYTITGGRAEFLHSSEWTPFTLNSLPVAPPRIHVNIAF